MPSFGLSGDTKFVAAAVIGVLLVSVARWASRVRGSKRDLWIALRAGDVLLTEILGAFLIGYGLGGLIGQPEAAAASGPGPGRFVPAGRFGGGLAVNLPVALGFVGAIIAVVTRLDLSGLALRSAKPRNSLAMYVGWEGRVIAPISAGGFGQIALRDALGYPLSAVATADEDIAQDTPVRVIGTKGVNLLVARTETPGTPAPPTTG
jgi:membrane-bound ClpP family serine protease